MAAADPSPNALVHQLPLPLAQVLIAALNSRSAVERHNHAYYLGEAALKLAASARIGLRLAHGPLTKPLERRLADLGAASVGHWCGLLRDFGQAVAEDCADSPLAVPVGRRRKRRAVGAWDRSPGS